MSTWGEYYHKIASEMALYRQSNRRMAELADLRPGMTVVDLACGSGLTSLAALEQAEGLTLYLVDSSPSMIEQARRVLGDRVALYQVASAEQLDQVVSDKVDRVLCNLSFWSFKNPEAVLAAARKVIKPTGRLLFSWLGTFFNTGGDVVSPQWALLRLLQERGELQRTVNPPERLPNQRSIEGSLSSSGFKPFLFDILEIESAVPDTEPGGELYNLVRLNPPLRAPTLQEAVQRTLALLPQLADEIARWHPRWRVAFFGAQPQLTMDEALASRLGKLPK